MARVVIEVPPLRERIEDIGILAKQFIAKYRKRYEGRLSIPEEMPIDPSDMEQMRNYRWPGNVRELEAVIERGLILDELHDGIFRLAPPDREKMDKTAKPVAVPTDTGGPAIPLIQDGDFISIEMIKDQAIELALKHTNGNKSQAAAYLGISPLTIDRRQKSLNPRPVESQ
jgi:DNA-binding NtrC family response regulator